MLNSEMALRGLVHGRFLDGTLRLYGFLSLRSHIRSLGPLNVKTAYFEIFEQLVWRFAPVACVLILMLTLCIINLDLVPEYEMVKLFVEDPIEFSYVQMFGV